MRDTLGNLPALPGIFPDTMAPVVRPAADGVHELALMRWSFPLPPSIGTRPVTNVRDVESGDRRPWLKPGSAASCRSAASASGPTTGPRSRIWFALSGERPLFWFAGIWRPWTADRRGETGEHRLLASLTSRLNAMVAPIHADAMPGIPATGQACETWLRAPVEDALVLQRPAPDGLLRIVATGMKTDAVAV